MYIGDVEIKSVKKYPQVRQQVAAAPMDTS